ncbi:hypothetical protein AKJ16_DCAP18005, partial [Drosera capensis]
MASLDVLFAFASRFSSSQQEHWRCWEKTLGLYDQYITATLGNWTNNYTFVVLLCSGYDVVALLLQQGTCGVCNILVDGEVASVTRCSPQVYGRSGEDLTATH